VADWQRSEPHEVAITVGASLALVATLCTLPRPASILVPRPYYSAYSQVPALLGLDLLTYELDREPGWQLSANSVAQSIRADTRALILNHPHNPTGGITDAPTLRQVEELASDASLLVISDETYAGIVFDGASVPDLRSIFRDRDLVRILSFSKLFGMPGERLGCTIAARERTTSIINAHWSLAMSAPASGQAMALQALRAGPDRHIRALVDQLARNRERAIEILSKCRRLRFLAPSGGCFIWIEVVDCPLDSRSFAQLCHEVGGVKVVSGHFFGVPSPAHIRVSFAVPPDELTAGLRRLVHVASTLESSPRTC
jgi:arginine:pyruvate transaminase